MNGLEYLYKCRKAIIGALLSTIKVLANFIDIGDSLKNLLGFDWLGGVRPEYIDYFVLAVAVVSIIVEYVRTVKSRDDDNSN